MATGDKIYIADKETLDMIRADTVNIKGKVGATTDTGGNTSSGTLFAKLNAIISSIASHVAIWTSARASKIDTIATDAATVKDNMQALIDSPSGGQGTRSQRFTSNGTFVVPAGVTSIKVLACAAGATGTLNKGGRGGQCFEGVLPVVAGQNIAITVGSGNTVIGDLLTLIAGMGAPAGVDTMWAKAGGNGAGVFGGTGGGAGLGGGGGGGCQGGESDPYLGGNGGSGLLGSGGGGGGGGKNGSNLPGRSAYGGAASGAFAGDGGSGGFGGNHGIAGAAGVATGGNGATSAETFGGGGGGGGAMGAGGAGYPGNASSEYSGGGGGGGGGYGAGGGGGGYSGGSNYYPCATPGSGGPGIVVISW